MYDITIAEYQEEPEKNELLAGRISIIDVCPRVNTAMRIIIVYRVRSRKGSNDEKYENRTETKYIDLEKLVFTISTGRTRYHFTWVAVSYNENTRIKYTSRI